MWLGKQLDTFFCGGIGRLVDRCKKCVEVQEEYVLYIYIYIYICWSTASTCNTDTTPTQPHRNSNTHRTKNNTTNVVIQQHSRKLLVMDILMSETCWVHKKWNKTASDIKLVFYSSTIAMMHGPINIKFSTTCFCHFTWPSSGFVLSLQRAVLHNQCI